MGAKKLINLLLIKSSIANKICLCITKVRYSYLYESLCLKQAIYLFQALRIEGCDGVYVKVT